MKTVVKMSIDDLKKIFLEVATKNKEDDRKRINIETKITFRDKIKNIFSKNIKQEIDTKDKEDVSYDVIGAALGNWEIVHKDISDIYFGLENFEITDQCISNKEENLMGFKTIENGFTFLGCYGGADYELPVFFIIYYDGENFRGYAPKQGNIFNIITKTAFGSESDIEMYHKLSEKDRNYAEELCSKAMEEDNEFNWFELKNDILNNIETI